MAQKGAAAIAPPSSGNRKYDLPLEEAGVGRAVNRLAWPIIAENVFQSGLGTANMIMVSQFGAPAIAGIGVAMQVFWVLQASVVAVTTGTTVLVARHVGAREEQGAHEVAKQSLLMGLVISAVFGVAGWFFSEAILSAMGAAPEVVALGTAYMQINAVFAAGMVLMFIAGAALRGAGDSRTPMLVTGGINVINVIASYVLIFGAFGLPVGGVEGAAWAAVLSRGVGAAVLLYLLVRGTALLSIRGWSGWRPNLPLIRRMMRLGLPSMGEQFFMSGGMLLYGVIAISLGTVVYATQQITFQVLSISFFPGMGFAMAATTIVSQYLGARRDDLSEFAGRYATKAALVWMTLIGACVGAFGDPLMRVFTNDPAMVSLGAGALVVIAFSQPFFALAQVISGGLRGAGDTRFPMWATFIGIWLVRLPLGMLFGPVLGWGLGGIYIANVVDAATRAAANYWRYRSNSWRGIQV